MSSGPYRLSYGWRSRSLVSCVTTCTDRYTADCYSVIYNTETHLCTPGKWLNITEAAPSIEEGQLYLGYDCDESSGFKLYVYNHTLACVFYKNHLANFSIAEQICRSLDGFLYTIKTLDKLRIIQSIADSYTWIGLDDRLNEGHFVWSDDNEEVDPNLMSQIFWSGEPNNKDGDEDCCALKLGKTPADHLLNDNNCSNARTVACEKHI